MSKTLDINKNVPRLYNRTNKGLKDHCIFQNAWVREPCGWYHLEELKKNEDEKNEKTAKLAKMWNKAIIKYFIFLAPAHSKKLQFSFQQSHEYY